MQSCSSSTPIHTPGENALRRKPSYRRAHRRPEQLVQMRAPDTLRRRRRESRRWASPENPQATSKDERASQILRQSRNSAAQRATSTKWTLQQRELDVTIPHSHRLRRRATCLQWMSHTSCCRHRPSANCAWGLRTIVEMTLQAYPRPCYKLTTGDTQTTKRSLLCRCQGVVN